MLFSSENYIMGLLGDPKMVVDVVKVLLGNPMGFHCLRLGLCRRVDDLLALR